MGIARDSAYFILGNEKNTLDLRTVWNGYEERLFRDGVIVSEFRVSLATAEYSGKDGKGIYYFGSGNTYFFNTLAGLQIKYSGDQFQKLIPVENIILNDPVYGLNQFRTQKNGGTFTSALPLEKERFYIDAEQRTDASRNSEIELEIDVKKKYEKLGYNAWDTEGKETISWTFNAMGKICGIRHTVNVKTKKTGSALIINERREIRPLVGLIEVPKEFPELGAGEWVGMNAVPQGLVREESDGAYRRDTYISTASPYAEQKQAFEKAKRFADLSDPAAGLDLARFYWDGIGCTKDQAYATRILNDMQKRGMPTTGFKKNLLGAWSKL